MDGEAAGTMRVEKAPPPRRRRRYSIRAAAEKGANAQVSAAFLAAFGYTRRRRSDARGRNRQHEGLGMLPEGSPQGTRRKPAEA